MTRQVSCRDQCGAVQPSGEEAMRAGWTEMSMRGHGWRCGPCTRSLAQAGGIVGVPAAKFVDPLPLESTGALRKETASTISAPVVKN